MFVLIQEGEDISIQIGGRVWDFNYEDGDWKEIDLDEGEEIE